MPTTLQIIATLLAMLFLQLSNAGEPPPKEALQPKALPSLEQRVQNAELIVRVNVEIKHRVLVYRIVETLKGNYDPNDYPDQYKGFFTNYTSASGYKPKHKEEIWFLGKSQVLYAPDKKQNEPDVINGYAAKVYYERLELPVLDGGVLFPTVGRLGKVLETDRYKLDDFIHSIRTSVKNSINR